MLGKRKRQKRLFTGSTMLPQEDLDRMGFYRDLAKSGEEIFSDDDFAELYSEDKGRPSVPPSLLALATLLQFREGLSDRQVIGRARFDLRWKVALHQDPLSTEAPFSRTTFQVFRSRLTLHEQEGKAFERSVKVARKAGLLPKRLRLAVDSTSVRGRGAVRDTFNLLSDAIAKVIRKIAATRGEEAVETARKAGLERHLEAPSIKGSEELDWQDKDEVTGFLQRLLADAKKAAALACESGQASEEAELLQRIVQQDVDEGDDETPPSIRKGVAKDRVVSVADPEVRSRRDSQSKKTTGHKAHAAVDTESGVITGVDVTSPSDPEGGTVEELAEESRRTTGLEVDPSVSVVTTGTAHTAPTARSTEPRPPGSSFAAECPGDRRTASIRETSG